MMLPSHEFKNIGSIRFKTKQFSLNPTNYFTTFITITTVFVAKHLRPNFPHSTPINDNIPYTCDPS